MTGFYQLFFWVQRNNHFFKTRCLVSPWDKYIPFWPPWIWIYSFLYYIANGFLVATIQSIAEGVYLIFDEILLLLVQVLFFFFFPSIVPPEYRQYEVTGLATRYLKFVQGQDNGRNCNAWHALFSCDVRQTGVISGHRHCELVLYRPDIDILFTRQTAPDGRHPAGHCTWVGGLVGGPDNLMPGVAQAIVANFPGRGTVIGP